MTCYNTISSSSLTKGNCIEQRNGKGQRSSGEQMVDAEAAVQSHRMQFQNNRIHRVVISLMVLATWFFWYTTPRPVNSGGHNGPEGKDHTLSPSKPFNWSEVCYAVKTLYGLPN